MSLEHAREWPLPSIQLHFWRATKYQKSIVRNVDNQRDGCARKEYEEDDPGLLCFDHNEDHTHVNYGTLLPLVNSSRLGICGYIGPSDPSL